MLGEAVRTPRGWGLVIPAHPNVPCAHIDGYGLNNLAKLSKTRFYQYSPPFRDLKCLKKKKKRIKDLNRWLKKENLKVTRNHLECCSTSTTK